MNAIKLPVEARFGFSGEWFIIESNNLRLGQGLTETQAHQIALALNCHDALVDVVTRVRDHTDADTAASYRCDDREGCLDTCHSIAAAALAKVEEARKAIS